MNSSISKNILKSVKLIIVDERNRFLLQLRDNKKNLIFKNCWNFFGGQIENNENAFEALIREIYEELGTYLKKKPKKVFSWKVFNHNLIIENIFYIIKVKKNTFNYKKIKEGQKMSWFSFDDLVNIDLVPAIYHNLNLIKKFSNLSNKKIVYKFEKNLLKKIALKKKNKKIYFSQNAIFNLSHQNIILFNEYLKINNINLARICFHNSEKNKIHEMLIFHTKKNLIKKHKQLKESVSYYIFSGKIDFRIYDEKNKFLKSIILEKNNLQNQNNEFIRLPAYYYRKIKTLSDHAIFIEIANGPFKNQDTIWMN